MKTLALMDSSKLIAPNPLTLICSKTPSGSTNLAAVSWWTYLSVKPAIIGFAMMKPSFTGEIIRADKKVVLTVPSDNMPAKQIIQCSTFTGRTKEKVKEFGIELKNLPDCDIQIPAYSVVAIECTLREFVDVGDHYFYICDVKNVYGDENENPLFAWKGYTKIAPAKEG